MQPESTSWVKGMARNVDEFIDHCSLAKVDAVTQLFKRVLPPGYWGKTGSPDGAPLLYLTFDDGPDPRTTPYLLELLEEFDVKATFFLIGENVERHPELVQQIHDHGHLLANHTYSHSWMPTLRAGQIEREISVTNLRIEEVTGIKPHLFRPPYGIMDKRAGDCLREQGMTPVYWGSAPEDWSVPGTQRVIRRVMAKVSDGTVIVLHEGKFLGKQTIQAAKEIIYRCKQMGYELAKVEVSA